eukprot:85537-Chlamydomonas_euryale.AAC.1
MRAAWLTRAPLQLRYAGVAPPAWEGFRTRPGLAMSQDGRNWARIEVMLWGNAVATAAAAPAAATGAVIAA